MIELLRSVMSQPLPAKDAIARLLTFGNRVPIELRRLSLAPFDQAIFDACRIRIGQDNLGTDLLPMSKICGFISTLLADCIFGR